MIQKHQNDLHCIQHGERAYWKSPLALGVSPSSHNGATWAYTSKITGRNNFKLKYSIMFTRFSG